MRKKFIHASFLMSLTACSTGPSESDMNAAIQTAVDQTNKQIASVGSVFGIAGKDVAEAFKVEAPEVKKIGCKEDGEKAFLCEVEISDRNGSKVTPVRFVKSSEGWVTADQ